MRTVSVTEGGLFGRLFVLSESRFRGIIHKRCVPFGREAFSCFLV